MTDTAVIFDIIGRDRTSSAIAGAGSAFNKLAIGLAAGAAFASAKFVDMAGNFQQSMTRLKTGAGETQGNMKLVSNGILDLAGQVGESTKDLAAGMYLVESAGFHGADGLNVLKVAAQGAKVGNADMATVADAVTTALNAYHMSANQAAQATNALIAAEGQGKTNLEALSGSLSTVAPIAAVAHVSLNEVLGAMATMTGQGTDAASAATYLKQTIGQLSNPTQKAAMEMKALGLDSVKVSMNLGKNGLASTLQMLTDAIEKKMGPAGVVLIQNLQKAAKNTTDFQKVLANLPPTQQTYIGALANMVGGTKSMQAALELTGQNMVTFQHNTDVINEKVKAGGNTIEGWSDVQGNFNQKMAEAKGTLEALGIRIGEALLPKAQMMLTTTMSLVTWFTHHKAVAHDLAVAIGIMAAGFITWRAAAMTAEVATKAWMVMTKAWAAAAKIATAVQWLWNVAMDANPVGLIIIAIAALVGGIILLWTHSAGFRNFFIGLWSDIWKFLKTIGAWFAGPFAHFFVEAGKTVAAPFLWLWHNIMDPWYHFVMRILTSIANLFRDLALMFIKPLIDQYVIPPLKGVGIIIMWLYNNIVKPYFGLVVAYLKLLGDGFMLWWHTVESSIGWVASKITWVWDHITKPTFEFIAGKAQWLGGIFKEVFQGISAWVGTQFNNVVASIKWAINQVIRLINAAARFINSDFIDVANKLPGVNFPHIPMAPMLAQGGIAAKGGYAVVGDQGAEIVKLPTNATVYPHGSVPTELSGGGGARRVTFHGDTDKAFATLFKKLQRTGIISID